MNLRPDVVGELRSMFKEGATPSRLIRHIVERHDDERGHHGLIQAYFLEAFGIPIVRGLNPTDDHQHTDLRYAFLNDQLVHDMVQRREDWDPGFGSGASENWLDPLKASDDQQRLRQVQGRNIPELSRCWTQLTPKEQDFIQRSLATANGLHETVKILSRLAECLQQQLSELQASPAGTGHGDGLST
jgi:hypothetical protein